MEIEICYSWQLERREDKFVQKMSGGRMADEIECSQKYRSISETGDWHWPEMICWSRKKRLLTLP